MSDDNYENSDPSNSRRAFNVPGVVLLMIALLTSIHFLRTSVIDTACAHNVLLSYAFFPVRFDAEIMARFSADFPSTFFGSGGTFVTYGLLHGDWVHLMINCFWLLIFGSALARRFGTMRFLMISLVGTFMGALAHLFTHLGSAVPVVGASAAISAHMACAARFAFVPYGPLGRPRSDHPGSHFLPSLSIGGMIKNPRAASFLGIWFALNLFVGAGSGAVGVEANIAWEAHIGGFLAGLFLFPLLDPVKHQRID